MWKLDRNFDIVSKFYIPEIIEVIKEEKLSLSNIRLSFKEDAIYIAIISSKIYILKMGFDGSIKKTMKIKKDAPGDIFIDSIIGEDGSVYVLHNDTYLSIRKYDVDGKELWDKPFKGTSGFQFLFPALVYHDQGFVVTGYKGQPAVAELWHGVFSWRGELLRFQGGRGYPLGVQREGGSDFSIVINAPSSDGDDQNLTHSRYDFSLNNISSNLVESTDVTPVSHFDFCYYSHYLYIASKILDKETRSVGVAVDLFKKGEKVSRSMIEYKELDSYWVDRVYMALLDGKPVLVSSLRYMEKGSNRIKRSIHVDRISAKTVKNSN